MDQLKTAEAAASKAVVEARKERTERLKAAKTEAEGTLAEYRGELEAKYQQSQARVSHWD